MKKINKIRIIKTISVLSSTSILLSSVFLMTGGCKPSTENTNTESGKQKTELKETYKPIVKTDYSLNNDILTYKRNKPTIRC